MSSIPTNIFKDMCSLNRITDQNRESTRATGLFAMATETGRDFNTCCHRTAYMPIAIIIPQKQSKYDKDKKFNSAAHFEKIFAHE